MLSQRKTVFLQKIKSLDFWLVAIGWVMSLYVMALGVLMLLGGAWQGFVYFSLGVAVHPKPQVPSWVKIFAYILIILIL